MCIRDRDSNYFWKYSSNPHCFILQYVFQIMFIPIIILRLRRLLLLFHRLRRRDVLLLLLLLIFFFFSFLFSSSSRRLTLRPFRLYSWIVLFVVNICSSYYMSRCCSNMLTSIGRDMSDCARAYVCVSVGRRATRYSTVFRLSLIHISMIL